LKRANRLILLFGIFFAVAAFVGIIFLASNIGTAPNQPTTVAVVIAAKDIPLGEQITSDEVTTKDVPTTSAPTDSYHDTALVIGKTTRAAVKQGAVLTSSETFAAGSAVAQNVSALLDAGYRAMPVQVDQLSGVGTLINVGDRVDVVVGLSGPDKFPLLHPALNPVDGVNTTSTKVLIQNLQVIGTIYSVTAATPAPSGQAPQTTLSGQQELVILAVTPQQAEALKFAQMDGTITLILRSPKDNDAKDVATTGVILKTYVDQYGVIPPDLANRINSK
jgi:pilus assembly protein CpaB